MIVRGLTIMEVPEEEGVLLGLPVQVIAGDQVLTMAVHAVLCMIGIVDRTGGGVLITAGTGVLIMAGTGVLIMAGTGVLNTEDIAGIVFEVNFNYFLQLCSFFKPIYSVIYLQSFTCTKVENIDDVWFEGK
jgi:hypothetical protein